MPVWRDGVEGHSVYQALTAAQATLDGIVPPDEEQLAQVARARAVVAGVRGALGSIDPQLLPDRVLDGIVGNANQVRDSSNAYGVSGDASNLVALQDSLDIILANLGLGAFSQPVVIDALRDSLVRYRRAGRELVTQLEAQVTDANSDGHRSLEPDRGRGNAGYHAH